MMNDREFFNQVAFKWDDMCHHDENKINHIIDISEVKKDSKILDVGTGTGVLIKYLMETNPKEIHGVDLSENMIQVAKSKYKDDRVKFYAEDIVEFNEEKDFDYVFIYSAYPHFKDKEKLFSHLRKLMKENGKIIICHSQSKEDINRVHASKEAVKEHILPKAEITCEIMKDYFKINKCIDNDEMYYISAVK